MSSVSTREANLTRIGFLTLRSELYIWTLESGAPKNAHFSRYVVVGFETDC